MNQYYLYIMTNKKYGTLYTGVTNDLVRRVSEHKQGVIKGFTKKYNLKMLVYYEIYNDIKEAIKREKAIKKWNRKWKIELIEKMNPDWNDLYNEII
ncbi:MAG TPA: GIY-YIG nuclease family protein [Ignavibacteria bacterium]|nr:GIY-YIG nuclease family protein [Ignavibacteria bacterium]